ncbi:MAG: helix-turn-helix transcriptional regulator [Parachlamydiaceae bacterium]
MSAHTRKHPIREAVYVISGQSDKEEGVSWREAFREGIDHFSEIGLMLKGGRHKAGLTQKNLADQIGVKPHHISEMEHGKRPIGKKMAHRLSEIFNIDYRLFL